MNYLLRRAGSAWNSVQKMMHGLEISVPSETLLDRQQAVAMTSLTLYYDVTNPLL